MFALSLRRRSMTRVVNEQIGEVIIINLDKALESYG